MALSIFEQMGPDYRTSFVIANVFSDAEKVFINARNSKWQELGISFYFADVMKDALPIAKRLNADNLFLDSDVGVRRHLTLLEMKSSNHSLDIHVYEEGVGTYRTDLYSGLRRAFLSKAGVGTFFGGCKNTSSIYVCDPIHYCAQFPNANPDNVHRINMPPYEFSQRNLDELSKLFAFELPCIQRPDQCNLYLSSWEIDYEFLRKFTSIEGDNFIKLHPHIRAVKHNLDCKTLGACPPAELAFVHLKAAYKNVNVFSHYSSAAHYAKGSGINFCNLSE